MDRMGNILYVKTRVEFHVLSQLRRRNCLDQSRFPKTTFPSIARILLHDVQACLLLGNATRFFPSSTHLLVSVVFVFGGSQPVL